MEEDVNLLIKKSSKKTILYNKWIYMSCIIKSSTEDFCGWFIVFSDTSS